MTRLFLAVSLAVLCFAPAPAAAEPHWNSRSANPPRSLRDYEERSRQRHYEWKQRMNDLDVLDRQLERRRVRLRTEATAARLGVPSSTATRPGWPPRTGRPTLVTAR